MSTQPDLSAPSAAAELAHELRTPLAAIIGFADAMRGRAFGPLSARYVEHAQSIHTAGLHLLDLVEAMTDVAMVETGGRRRPFERFDALANIRNATSLFRQQARAAELKLIVNAPAAAMGVEADPLAISQILINLLANAMKFTARGGQVIVDVGREGDDLMISVHNRPAKSEAARYGEAGMGIGLRLVRALCALHGGAFEMRDAPDGGVSAIARLPIVAEA